MRSAPPRRLRRPASAALSGAGPLSPLLWLGLRLSSFGPLGGAAAEAPASRGQTPRSSRGATTPPRGIPRGAGPPRATGWPVPGGGLEPFQEGDGSGWILRGLFTILTNLRPLLNRNPQHGPLLPERAANHRRARLWLSGPDRAAASRPPAPGPGRTGAARRGGERTDRGTPAGLRNPGPGYLGLFLKSLSLERL